MLNMVGKTCPLPVIEAKKAIQEAGPGSQIQVLVDNDIARQNLQRMAAKQGCSFSFVQQDNGHFLITMVSPENKILTVDSDGLTVAIGKNTMGQGEDELGRMLLKNFIYSLTELDTPPESVLFFNGGVFLAVEGSSTLEDLRTLEEKGTSISSCGACLDFYKLKDKLAIGSVTNMYAIASAMAGARHLINL